MLACSFAVCVLLSALWPLATGAPVAAPIKKLTWMQQFALRQLKPTAASFTEFKTEKDVREFCKQHHFLSATPLNTTLSRMFFIVIGSTTQMARIERLERTWLKWVWPNYMVSMNRTDEERHLRRPELRPNAQQVLLSLANSPIAIRDREKRVADVFQLSLMQELCSNKTWLAQYDWVVLVDDDTFINVPRLLRFVQDFTLPVPLMLGCVYRYDERTLFFGGGAGMVLNARACHSLSQSVFSECPFWSNNDFTLTNCTPQARVLKVHSGLFLQEPFAPPTPPALRLPSVAACGQYISCHRIQNLSAFMEITCGVSRNMSFPHPDCPAHASLP